MKKLISLLLIIILLSCNAVYAAEKIKFYAGIQNEFKTDGEIPERVEFMTTEEVVLNDITIPAGSTIRAKVYQFQKERRWHRSGFFICSLTDYTPLEAEEPVDISEKEIYFAVRKYEAMSKKDATILTTEIILTQAASIVASCFIVFAPVDIAYFFTKGAIARKKHPNWFRSGVMEAYDNSIFWFWLKGKPIELSEGDDVKLKSMTAEKAEKINGKIEKKNIKKAAKVQKKEEKKQLKAEKKQQKAERKQQRAEEKQQNAENEQQNVEEEQRNVEKEQRNVEKEQRKAEKAQKKAERKQQKAEKKQQRAEKKRLKKEEKQREKEIEEVTI